MTRTITTTILTAAALMLCSCSSNQLPEQETSIYRKINSPQSHAFLGADYSARQIVIVSDDGQIVWKHPARGAQDVWMLPNGNILYNEATAVKEITIDKKVVWQYEVKSPDEIHACQPLDNGNYLVAVSGRCVLLEVEPSGNIAVEIQLQTPNMNKPHAQMRQVRKLTNGNYLVGHYPFDIAREYDSKGNVVSEIKTGSQMFGPVELPDGHLLIACGDGHKLIEYDADRNIVWQLNENDAPGNPLRFVAGCQRRPNGNTVICNWSGHGHLGKQPQIFEVTPDKKVVWQIFDNQQFKSFSHVQMLNANGKVTKADLMH